MKNLNSLAARLRDFQAPLNTRRAPEENGVRLATIPRRDGDELRVNWSEYKDHNFVNLRVWREGSEGWFPVKEMGLTIRLAELADFAEGIGKAVELATAAPQAAAQADNAPSATKTTRKRSRRSTPPKNAPIAVPFDDGIGDIGAGR